MAILPKLGVLKTTRIQVFGDGSLPITVIDPAKPYEEQKCTGDYFVRLPESLAAILPGSVVLPEEFLKEIGVKVKREYWSRRLIGRVYGNEKHPVFSFQEENFLLRVFHGSTNPHALNLTRLAAVKNGFANEKIRADYQREQRLLIQLMLNLTSVSYFRIIEDCIASGDTIMGVLTLLNRQRKVPKGGKVRIDVVVSTTQGILILKEFAKQNNLSLEINAGYLAYGLSKGRKILQSSARIHANYLVYPQELLELLPEETATELERLKSDDNIYVVGDMGDAAKRLRQNWNKKYPWNRLRTDNHGLIK